MVGGTPGTAGTPGTTGTGTAGTTGTGTTGTTGPTAAELQALRMAPFTKPEKVSLDMVEQTTLSPQRQLRARVQNCT
ncbi:MAG: hypothetical protein ACK5T0_09975 [Vampirovibrionales bacterium]